MRKIENQCVGCETGRFPCIGSSCPLRNTEVVYCDICEEEGEIYSITDITGDCGEYCYDHAKEKIKEHVRYKHPDKDEDDIDEMTSNLFADRAELIG